MEQAGPGVAEIVGTAVAVDLMSSHDGALTSRHGGSILLPVSAGPGSESRVDGEPIITVRRAGDLSGRVMVPGAKNSVLKLMAACLLADGTSEISNVPGIADVSIMSELLEAIGLRLESPETGVLRVTNPGDLTPVAPYELVERIRASINVLGPLLTRCGHVRLSLPGGDDFGARPIDMHIAGLEAMGAEFKVSHGYLEARADRLHGAEVVFDFPSVGATENILTAAVFADGVTRIDNAAREPEVVDLCRFLVAMGADIEGVGTATLTVRGVERGSLRPATHRTVPDRVQAATYIAAVAVAGGELEMVDAHANHMDMLLARCRDMGVDLEPFTTDGVEGLRVSCSQRLRATDVQTLPYPGIATDYKPLIITMLSVADGVAIVTENLYPGRFRYVEELIRLGADIRTDGHHAVVRGQPRLSGAPVRAHDIRAGAAMVVAGLAAEGTTTISGVRHIDRGYDDLVGRLAAVGADITRVED